MPSSKDDWRNLFVQNGWLKDDLISVPAGCELRIHLPGYDLGVWPDRSMTVNEDFLIDASPDRSGRQSISHHRWADITAVVLARPGESDW